MSVLLVQWTLSASCPVWHHLQSARNFADGSEVNRSALAEEKRRVEAQLVPVAPKLPKGDLQLVQLLVVVVLHVVVHHVLEATADSLDSLVR